MLDVPAVMSAMRMRLSSNMTPPLSTGGLVSWLTSLTLLVAPCDVPTPSESPGVGAARFGVPEFAS